MDSDERSSRGMRELAETFDDLDELAVGHFVELMDDDLQTPQALALVFDLVREANAALDAGDADRGTRLGRTVAILTSAMGLTLDGGAGLIDEEARALAAERDRARSARDFARADAIRDQLQSLGWVVEDTVEGTALRR
jgi:cysteinyl-tRNA synthetase